MPEKFSRQRLKKKVIDRWENEGGKIGEDLPEIVTSGSPDNRPSEGDAAVVSEMPPSQETASPQKMPQSE